MGDEEERMDTAIAVVLAAGEGKRMGMPKALLEYEKGKSFLTQLAKTFEKVGCRVLAVVGKDAAAVPNALVQPGGKTGGRPCRGAE